MDREATQNDAVDPEPPFSSIVTITGSQVPFVELRMPLFTPSKKHTVTRLDTVIFDKFINTITHRYEKWLKMGTQADVVTLTKNTIMEGTHKNPKFLASVNIAVA